MNMHRIPVAVGLVFSISWILQTLPSVAQSRADGQAPQDALHISLQEVLAHFAEGQRLVHSDVPDFSLVTLKLVVTPTGRVGSATPIAGRTQWYEKTAGLAMAWHFVPFERRGIPVYATFNYSVRVVPPEQRPTQHQSFPEIKDWSTLRIMLVRSGCRGHCPSYKLTVFGDGSIIYNGVNYVDYCGEYRAHVSSEAVHALVDLFKDADYFNLFDRYGKAFDGSDFITSIAFDNRTKSVFDESGLWAGMPEIVRTVEDGIDRLVGPQVWAREIETHPGCWSGALGSDLLSRIE